MALCHWGILSTAAIAQKNWKAMFNAENATVVAVASRSEEKAQHFINNCNAECPMGASPTAYGSYEELLAADNIDAVYIPLPTGLRKEWVIRAAEAGKHVLCEKPTALNAEDLKEMISACAMNHVQFMDGVMFMHSKRLTAIKDVLNDANKVGNIRRIYSQFSFLGHQDFLEKDIRLSSDLEPYGCLGDLGWYPVRFILWAMQWALPKKVSARVLTSASGLNSSNAVPIAFSAELFYSNDLSAGFYCAFTAENQQWVCVSGDKGYLTLKDFVLPFHGENKHFEVMQADFQIDNCQFNLVNKAQKYSIPETGSGHLDSQETNMIRFFSHLVLSNRVDPYWPEIAMKTQLVVDACFQSSLKNGVMVVV